MLHAYAARFDVTENLKKNLDFEVSKQGLNKALVSGFLPLKESATQVAWMGAGPVAGRGSSCGLLWSVANRATTTSSLQGM